MSTFWTATGYQPELQVSHGHCYASEKSPVHHSLLQSYNSMNNFG